MGKVSDVRMGAQELCLRFVAFYRLYDTTSGGFQEFCEMTRLLDYMILRINDMNPEERDDLFIKFIESMKKCYALFGETAFYKSDAKTAINRALFTSFSVLLADYNHYSIEWLKEQQNRANELMRDKYRQP